jgi:SAM-dependent methyltransferase
MCTAVTPAERDDRMRAHYRDRFRAHGPTPQGVDWNGAQTQRVQFDVLLDVVSFDRPVSLNDLGCGYGALADHLMDAHPTVRYRGYDLNVEMIDVARARHAGREQVSFHVADRPLETADYGIASGIYTLRLGRTDDECFADMTASLDALDATSEAGFAFNCLTSYSDADRMKDYLYYPDPRDVFDLCKRRYARNVALLHDYDLYGFTMLVRKRGAR